MRAHWRFPSLMGFAYEICRLTRNKVSFSEMLIKRLAGDSHIHATMLCASLASLVGEKSRYTHSLCQGDDESLPSRSSRKQSFRCVLHASALSRTRERSLVSYSLETAFSPTRKSFSRARNGPPHFAPVFRTRVSSRLLGEKGREGESTARVNKDDEGGCGSGAVDLVDEALDSLIILYRGSLAANFGNLFAVTVLSPHFRRKSRGERRTMAAEG